MKIPSGSALLNPYQILKQGLELDSGARVADLGCGAVGHFTIQAAKLVGDKGRVHAVDVLKNSLANVSNRAAIEKLDNVQTHWTNLEKFGALEIHDQTMDYVLLINVLFQNKNITTVVKEACRLLKPGGKMLVIDWLPGRFPVGPSPSVKVDPEKIQAAAGQFGLVEIKSFAAGQYHYGLIFRKN